MRVARTRRPSSCCTDGRYDIHSFVDVTPRLVSAGYRVIVPCTCAGTGRRGFCRMTRSATVNQSAVAMDAVELMNALKIERATIAGFDWGARSGRHHRARCGPSAARGSSR